MVSPNMNSETKKYAIFVNVTQHCDHSIQKVFSHWMFICNHVKYGIKIYKECFIFFCMFKNTDMHIWMVIYMSNRSLQLDISDFKRNVFCKYRYHAGLWEYICGKKTIWQSNNMWNMCWTTWQWDTFFLSIFVFSWFNPTPAHVELVVVKVVLGEVFLWTFWFSHQHCSTNAPQSHFIHLPLTRQNLRKKMTGLLNKLHPHPLQSREVKSFYDPL